MYNDTALIRLTIVVLADRHNWTFEDTLDRFYNSEACLELSDKETGYFTISHLELAELFDSKSAN